jgi:HSP90 family molecular chaperone
MDVARSAPFVEKLVADGYEVLYLTEAVDEAMVGALAKYGDHDLVDVTKEGLDLGSGGDSKKVRVGAGWEGGQGVFGWVGGWVGVCVWGGVRQCA